MHNLFQRFRRITASVLLLVLSVFLLTSHAAGSGSMQNQYSGKTQTETSAQKSKSKKQTKVQKPKSQNQAQAQKSTSQNQAQAQKPKSQNQAQDQKSKSQNQAQDQKSKSQNQAQGNKNNQKNKSVQEDGTYTSKEEVALYLHTYGHLPSNYITKKDAEALGWNSSKGNLWDVAPGKSIGGSRFGNYEKQLPDKKGRRYYECDIDYDGKYRNAKRILYSDDGLIFYTEDHYKSFEQLY